MATAATAVRESSDLRVARVGEVGSEPVGRDDRRRTLLAEPGGEPPVDEAEHGPETAMLARPIAALPHTAL